VAHRVGELLVEPPATLPDRYTEQRPAAPGNPRIIEGEILPRSGRDDALLDAYRARVLHGQAEPVAPPATTVDTSGLLPASVVFYTLHSSAANLFAEAAGRHVDQYV
jgi:hypothetical protein